MPQIPGENNEKFTNDTLKLLLQGKNLKFGNPISQFKMKLVNGKYSDIHWRKKEIIGKYRKKKRKLMLVTEHFSNLSEMSKSEEQSLSHEVKRLSRHTAKKLKTMNLDERVGKRHITELRRIRLEVQEKGDSSDDEEFIRELMNERDRKMAKIKTLQDWQQSNKSKLPDPPPLESIDPNLKNLPALPALEEIAKPTHLTAKIDDDHDAKSTLTEQESNYFSLLRFFFCQTVSNALTIPELMDAVKQWELTANRQLITWMSHSTSSWVNEIPSAIAFLCGAFPHAQPPGFQPLIACDSQSGLYTWIRLDPVTPMNLSHLTSWWLKRRAICQAVTSDNSESNQRLSKATLHFRAQEKIRMLEKPTEFFVYELSSEEGVVRKVQVGPVQNPPESYLNDGMMKGLMNDPRVSFYSVMQDALSRLPNGRGSLDDIRLLLEDSQYVKRDTDANTLLKKIALALTHFQKGQMQPFCAFDPATRQYVLQSAPQPPVPQPRPPLPQAPVQAVQLQPRPRPLQSSTPQVPQLQPIIGLQPEVKQVPKVGIPSTQPPRPPPPMQSALGKQVVQQRNVGHLVQVRTPQGLKLYRLASPMQVGQNPRLMLSPQGQPSVPTPPRQQQPQQPRVASPAAVNAEDTVIVRNSDGKLVQMPRAVLKKLINSGQVKQQQQQQTQQASQHQIATATSDEQRINSNDVLNLLPTVPVRQEQLRPADQH